MRAAADHADASLIEQAIRWRVLLESGNASADDERACADWCAADPQHAEAWQALASIGARLRLLPPRLAHRALDRREPQIDPQRRALLRGVVLAGALSVLGYASRDWRGWLLPFADVATAVGERRQLLLGDGTQLALNTDTVVQIEHGPAQRLLRLRRGEILVTTGHPDDAATRPFIVETDAGRIRALGTRFRVRRNAAGTEVATEVDVFEGAVEIQPRHGSGQRLDAGLGTRFDRDGAAPRAALRAEAAAWVDGLLIARDQPLDHFVAELARHRPGWLHCAADAATLRISGVFPLDDGEAILAALERTLPVTVERRSAYWLRLRRRDGAPS